MNHIEESMLFFQTGEDKKAMELIRKASILEPTDLYVLQMKSVIFYYNLKFKTAYDTSKTICRLIRNMKKTSVHDEKLYFESALMMAKCEVNCGLFQEAKEKFDTLLQQYSRGKKTNNKSRSITHELRILANLEFLVNTQNITLSKTLKDKKMEPGAVFDEQYQKLFAEDNFKACRKLLAKKIFSHVDSYYYWILLAQVEIESSEYSKALAYAEIANQINPEDPLVWDIYALALYYNKHFRKALKLWLHIVQMGLKELQLHPNSENNTWALSLFIDAHYNAALCYDKIRCYPDAYDYYTRHLKLRRKAVPSKASKKHLRERMLWIEKNI